MEPESATECNKTCAQSLKGNPDQKAICRPCPQNGKPKPRDTTSRAVIVEKKKKHHPL